MLHVEVELWNRLSGMSDETRFDSSNCTDALSFESPVETDFQPEMRETTKHFGTFD